MSLVIKKYGNRRLYDTQESRYITLEELSGTVRDRGDDVRVVDAKTGRDLTQETLAQIILESRGGARLLPVPLLVQMIKMGDDALGEFFSRYLGLAMELYWQARQGAQAFAPVNPLATLPFSAGGALARLFSGGAGMRGPATPEGAASEGEVAELRREMAELRASLRKPAPKKRRRSSRRR